MTMLGQGAIMETAATIPAEHLPADRPVRVMVVDDSVVVRGLVSRWIEEEPGLEVVARHANGKLAVEDVVRSAPDVILLDIEMPVMNGLEALPLLLRARPDARVLMVSTLTKRNAEISFKALSLGALDYLPKPDTNREITISPDFHLEVVRKVKALAGAHALRSLRGEVDELVAREELPPSKRRSFSMVPPRVIAIGSSTGGPQALTNLLGSLSPSLSRIPVLVAQHMPPMFTTILAERLARATGRETKEGVDGERLVPGTIYVAPGDHHMTVRQTGTPSLRISGGPLVNFCRPAADPLFSSVAASFGPAALGVVLTGMGQDGAAGARAIADAGGSVIAQDEASSVVWGMPGAAVASGACAALLPPLGIADAIAKLVRGERP
jgi:two-component system, chemotaxis family, protein-glutamate methylesterase/glutaminase